MLSKPTLQSPPARLAGSLASRLSSRAVVLAAATVLLAGCHSARVAEPLPADAMGPDETAQMAFWYALPERKIVGNDEALHAFLLFLDGADPAADYPARVEALKSRNLLPKGFNRPADEAVTRGTLAVAFARALDIKGGLSMTLFGPTQRYATRELMYIGLFPASSPNQTFSGQELIGIFGRAEDFQRAAAGRKPPGAHEEPPISQVVGESPATQPALPTTNPLDTNANNPDARNPAIPAPGAPIRE